MRALADAGAACSIIHASLCRDLKLPLYPDKMEARGVTGAPLANVGRTAAKITLGMTEHNQCLHVAENTSQNLILGADYLEKLGDVTYNFKKGIFKVGQQQFTMGEPEDSYLVRTVNAVHIPPLSEVAVLAEVRPINPTSNTFSFSGTNRNTSRSLLVGNSLSVMKGNRITVPIMNVSQVPLQVQVNTLIGEASEVDEDDILMSNINRPNRRNKERPGDTLEQEKTTLDDTQMPLLRNLINEYSDIIGEGIDELGRTNVVQHFIQTKPGVNPIRSRPYNIPVGLRAEIKKQIDTMLERNMIEMSSGIWSSPVVIVKKKDNTHRFCVDYRKLNAVTEKQSMCLSNIDNVMEIMHGKRYFSALDLCSGFFQVELHEESQEKSSFITPWGCYKWKVMPQGASGSPSTFARLSMAIMADLISSGSSVVYLDDWLLTSVDFDSHLALLRTVFERLRFTGLKYRLSKSHFFQKEITYLGHVISEDGITVAPHNVEKIRNFPDPKTATEVRRILGMFGFYRSFVKGYSKEVLPLTKLTGDTPFVWTAECAAAVNKLKDVITSAPVLVFPDFGRPFLLTTDASGLCIGAVLSQRRDDGKQHPISFYSKTLNKHERKWATCEQELFAILCSVKRYRGYLMNVHFFIQTDNMACVFLLKSAELTGRLARWAIQLADYDFTISHTPGKENVVADALSRAEFVNLIIGNDEEPSEQDKEMHLHQSKDYFLGPILLYMSKGRYPPDASKRASRLIRKESEDFELLRGVLYKKVDNNLRLAIPVSQRKNLIWASHDSLTALHQGVTKTLLKLRSQYWWPHMTKEVTEYIAQCDSCQRKKNPKVPMRVPLKNQMATSPFEILSVDFQGPFVESVRGNKHILVWTDHFTKWIEMEATKDQTAQTVARSYVERIFCRYGSSRVLISDRAKNFLSDVVREINRLLKVDHRKTSPYHPQCNGQVEVYNRPIAQALSHVVNETHTDWCAYLPFVMLAHNSSRHTIINASPSLLLQCRELRLPHELTMPSVPEDVEPGTFAEGLHTRMSIVWDAARNAIQKGKDRQKRYYDVKSSPSTIKVGDAVLYFNPRGYIRRTSKLIKRWQGPYIVKAITDTNARLSLFNDPDAAEITVHLNKLKIYLGPLVRGDPNSSDFEIDLDSPGSDSDDVADTGLDAEMDLYEQGSASSTGQQVGSATGDLQVTNGYNQTPDGNQTPDDNQTPVGVQDGSRVEGSGGASTEAPSRTEAEPITDRRYGLRRRPRKKRDPQFVYSEADLP